MNRTMTPAVGLALMMVIACSASRERNDLATDLPQGIDLWKATSTEIFKERQLYDYMDGGAELYNSFGFRELVVRRFTSSEKGDIVLEIYRMDTPANAFGIFAHDRQDSSIGIGQESEFGDGWLRFWKGRFYVSIYAEEPGERADSAVLQLGRQVDQLIGETGAPPAILQWLPSEGLVGTSVKYFHDQVSLNHYHFIARENILGLGSGTDGTLAAIRGEGGRSVVTLIRYPDRQLAETALRNFCTEYLRTEAPGDTWSAISPTKWAGAGTEGNVLLLVLESPSAEEGKRLLAEMRKRVKENGA